MARVRGLRRLSGNVQATKGWKPGMLKGLKPLNNMPVSPAFIPDLSESRELHDTRVEMLQLACQSVNPSKEVVSIIHAHIHMHTYTYVHAYTLGLLQVIADFMEKTFQFRRCDVLEKKFQLEDLLLIYPPLRDPDEVMLYKLCVLCCFTPYSLVMSLTE